MHHVAFLVLSLTLNATCGNWNFKVPFLYIPVCRQKRKGEACLLIELKQNDLPKPDYKHLEKEKSPRANVSCVLYFL